MLTSVFKHLFSIGWRHYWSIQLQFSLANKPPIFLSQVDKSGGWWYMCLPWRWDATMFFLKLFRSTPQTCFCPLTRPNSQFSTFVNLGLFFSCLSTFPMFVSPQSIQTLTVQEFSFSLLWPWSCSAPLWHTDTTAELNEGHPAERDAKKQKNRYRYIYINIGLQLTSKSWRWDNN